MGELTKVLQNEGMLKADNLVSAGLYDPKGLADFLNHAQQPGFTWYRQLQVLVSVELGWHGALVGPGPDR